MKNERRQQWDVKEFAKTQAPSIVRSNIQMNQDVSRVRVLDMPIYMPDQGYMPARITEPFDWIIMAAMENELKYGNPSSRDMYVYITIDQKRVKAGTTGRRAGAHSDGYVETDNEQVDIIAENADIIAKQAGPITHTYVWYDCLPTEFFKVPFPLGDRSDKGSLRTFDDIADSCSSDQIVTYPEQSLLFLTPYVVHRCAVADKTCYRTFVKISVSDKLFRRKGNTHNPLFDYAWDMSKRSPHKRNTPWVI